MRRLPVLLLIVLSGLVATAAAPKNEPCPKAISNNAVAGLKVGSHHLVYSFMGIGAKKTWDDIQNAAYELDLGTGKWTELRPVPGAAGRIAAGAASARDHVFLFGGYVVDGQGQETTVPDVGAYDPISAKWFRGADIPVAVDDFVIGVDHERYVYLVSGWSRQDAVRNVQVYDTEKNTWEQATPIPGTPVFGHAGGLADGTIVYVDGAYKNPAGANPKYVASDECWMGKIDRKDPKKITWSKLAAHPGKARYRMAAAGSDKDGRIYFSGGTDNPYNYDGVGYDGRPSEPSGMTFAFNVHSGKWETIGDEAAGATMDHRGLVVEGGDLVVVGGMEAGQKVTGRVTVLPKEARKK